MKDVRKHVDVAARGDSLEEVAARELEAIRDARGFERRTGGLLGVREVDDDPAEPRMRRKKRREQTAGAAADVDDELVGPVELLDGVNRTAEPAAIARLKIAASAAWSPSHSK